MLVEQVAIQGMSSARKVAPPAGGSGGDGKDSSGGASSTHKASTAAAEPADVGALAADVGQMRIGSGADACAARGAGRGMRAAVRVRSAMPAGWLTVERNGARTPAVPPTPTAGLRFKISSRLGNSSLRLWVGGQNGTGSYVLSQNGDVRANLPGHAGVLALRLSLR